MKTKIKEAIKILKNGGLVIFPTETVYGLGADATNDLAIEKLYKIKNRPINNPIICHFKNLKDIEINFEFNDIAYELAKKFWPGPLTLILKKKNNSKVSQLVSNKHKLVGCRIPNNTIAQELLNNLDFPIAAPSANISTKLSTTKISQLSSNLKKNVFYLDGGDSYYGLESTVVNIIKNKVNILRLGSITYEKLKQIIPNTIISNEQSNSISPGLEKKHYSPNKPIRINIEKVLEGEALLNFSTNQLKSDKMELNLSLKGDLNEASKNLYNYMHILDNSDCIGIAVAPIPNENLGKTINDRLKRASFKNN